MSCFGCEKKEQLTNLAVDVLVEEQLAVEINRASLLVQSNRTKICDRCPFRQEHTCSKCGCFYKFRAGLSNKDCPVGKW